jgi:hypothetical protein
MRKRGKILRDTSAGPGLLIVEGRQYQFPLQGVWCSEVSPRPGMVVDVDFGVFPALAAITAVPESQLAREQAEADLAKAREKRPALTVGTVRIGRVTVAGMVLLVSWFSLTALSLETPLGREHFTFWQVLGFIDARNPLDMIMPGGTSQPNPGLYALPVLALTGPFVGFLWTDRRACLGGLLPLIFMTIVGLMIRSKLDAMLLQHSTDNVAELAAQTKYQVVQTIAVGPGVYLSLLAGAYLAAEACWRYLAARTSQPGPTQSYTASA